MWGIMKQFNVLPTDPRFRELTKEQIDFILYSKELDIKEQDRARRGMALDAEFEDYEADEWWNASHEDFKALKDDHDEEDIARQVNALTSEEDRKIIQQKLKDYAEFDASVADGHKTFEEEAISAVLNDNLTKLFADAKKLEEQGVNKWGDKTDLEIAEEKVDIELGKMDSKTITSAIELFHGIEEEVVHPNQDDDFEI